MGRMSDWVRANATKGGTLPPGSPPADPPKAYEPMFAKGITDERWPALAFPFWAAVPGRDAPSVELDAINRGRQLGGPLPGNLRDPFFRLLDAMQLGLQTRVQACDAYVLKFDESETAMREGIRTAVDAVQGVGIDAPEIRRAAAEANYVDRI